MTSGNQDSFPQAIVEEKIYLLTRKLNRAILFRYLLKGLSLGFYLTCLIFLLYGTIGVFQNHFSLQWNHLSWNKQVFALPLTISSIFFLLLLLFSIIYGVFHFKNTYQAAILADYQLHLKDRLSTSTYLLEQGTSFPKDIQDFILQDSAKYAQDLDLSKVKVPSSAPVLSLFTSLFFCGLSIFSLAFLEPLQKPSPLLSPLEQASMLLAKEGKEIEKMGEKKKIREANKIGEILKKAAKKLKDKKIPPASALRKEKKKLEALKKEWAKKAFQKALQQAIKELKKSKSTQKIAKAMSEKKFDKALQEASKLRKSIQSNPKKFEKNKAEKKKLANSTRKSGKILKPTSLKKLAKELEEIAKILEPNKKSLSAKAMKAIKGLHKMKERQKMLAKAMKALKNAQKMLKGKQLGKGKKNLPVYKGPLPKGTAKMAKGGKSGNQKLMPPVQPGPMKKGGKGQGQQGEAKIWTGPCDYSCPYSGQCMKCPCRGKRKGICPYTKKRCKCKHCESSQGGGGSGASGAQPFAKGGANPSAGKGGLQAGKGAAGLGLKDPTKNPNKGRKTRVRGRASKDGKSMVMAIKAYKHKEESSVEYQKVWSIEKAAAEDALRKTPLPLHLRRLIKDYFDSIKPKENR